MRLASFCFLLFVLAGISAAQDMNFAVGPQYLMTSGSPMFARPIATPTLSLDAPLPSLPSLPEVGPPVADQPFVPNPEIQGPDLLPIYYGYPHAQRGRTDLDRGCQRSAAKHHQRRRRGNNKCAVPARTRIRSDSRRICLVLEVSQAPCLSPLHQCRCRAPAWRIAFRAAAIPRGVETVNSPLPPASSLRRVIG